MDAEVKELLKAILHRVELNGAKLDALQSNLDRIEDTVIRHEKSLDPYRHQRA